MERHVTISVPTGKTDRTKAQSCNQCRVGQEKCYTELVTGGQRGSSGKSGLGRSTKIGSCPVQAREDHQRCYKCWVGHDKAVPLAYSGTANGPTRQPRHCSALDTSEDKAASPRRPSARKERTDPPRKAPRVTSRHQCHIPARTSVSSCTCCSHHARCHSYLPDTHMSRKKLSHMPTVTCDERQKQFRHPCFPVSLHVLTDTGVWPHTGH